jgi:hypothetical protein
MTTEKQTEANRRNAELSTGPKSVLGKAATSRNATKWGCWSKDILIRGEKAEEFEEFLIEILADVQPVGALESWFAHEMVACAWRLGRIRRAEAEVFAQQGPALNDPEPFLGKAYLNDCRGLDALSKLARDESRIRRAFYRAYHELQRLQAARAGLPVLPPVVADVDVNVDFKGAESPGGSQLSSGAAD